MATEAKRYDAIVALHTRFDAALEDVRAVEHMTYLSHGHDDLVYADRVRELLHAHGVVGNTFTDPSLVAAMDTVALRSPGEVAWYAEMGAAEQQRQDTAAALEEFTLIEPDTADVPALNRCGRCRSDNVYFYQRQTRSADEGSTTFCKCLSCGKRWKQ